MASILEVLSQIRARPGMYLGRRSAIRLHSFIQGWLFGKGAVEGTEVLRAFQDWVALRHGVTSSHSWAEIITFYSEGDVEAFEAVFQLFDEFQSQRGAR